MSDNIFKSQQKNELLSPLLPVYYTTENEYSNEDIDKPLYLEENIENTKKTINIYKITNNTENENKICSSPDLSKSPINNKISINNLSIISSKNDNYLNDINNLISTFSYDGMKLFQDMKMETFKSDDNRIFQIFKDNKNKGRIKKNSNLIGKHNKFSEDNIIRKFKGRFQEKLRIYINYEYKKYLLNQNQEVKKMKDLIQRITPKISRIIKKKDNLEWLKKKLYQVFSENVSDKCTLYNREYNKHEINKIFKENKATNVINILNKSIGEMLYKFVNNIKVDGLETLDDDMIALKEKLIKENEDNINEYLKKYKNIAMNFEKIFINKSERNDK
jgi:hypothetical protein